MGFTAIVGNEFYDNGEFINVDYKTEIITVAISQNCT